MEVDRYREIIDKIKMEFSFGYTEELYHRTYDQGRIRFCLAVPSRVVAWN